MAVIESASLKNQLLKWLYDRAVVGKSDRYAAPQTMKRALKLAESSQVLGVMLDGLTEAGYVRELGQKYSITDAGMAFLEAPWLYAEQPIRLVDAWDKRDGPLVLSVSAGDSIKLHLSQCVTLISVSKFTQEEKAQIVGLIRICEQIMELPTPKLGLLKRILGWLREIKDLMPLIEAILKLLGRS